jgi:thioredoxin reductase
VRGNGDVTSGAELTPAVVVIGAGPAGLTAATRLAEYLPGEVLVLERERQPGGIPRHSDHQGFGLRDLHRSLSGPGYARALVARAVRAGVSMMTEAAVTDLNGDRTKTVTTPAGIRTARPQALILATGARERPRSARLVPGDRPAGVFTTGQLQNLVHDGHGGPGTRAVVVGAELVAWSAVLTLRAVGCRTVLMTTTSRRPDSFRAASLAGRVALRVPIACGSRMVAIEGRDRVRAVVVQDVVSGATRRVGCDTVVFTGDWIPDNELARCAGLDVDMSSKAPVVDALLRASRPGVFAIGNLVHPVVMADVCGLDGRHVVDGVLDWLRTGRAGGHAVTIGVDPPLRWIAPSRWTGHGHRPSRDRLLAWCEEFVRFPVVTVRQGDREIARRRLPWPAAPGRVFRIPAELLADADPAGPDVRLGIR